MKTKIYSLFAILTLSVTAWSQGVGINTTGAAPDASAGLDVDFNNKGLLPPRMTTAQRDAISSPATGLMVYNITLSCLQVNDGTPATPQWNCISGFVAPVNSILIQIGNEADSPDVNPSVVTATEIASISGITGVVPANETAYQDYIDANPNLFSAPATEAQVQAMIDAVNANESLLANIGTDADNGNNALTAGTEAADYNALPNVSGAIPANEAAYLAYIADNAAAFDSPATEAQVQAMIDQVNANQTLLANIGTDADNGNNALTTGTVAADYNALPNVSGAIPANEAAYLAYIADNAAAFDSPATEAQVQAMIDAVNANQSLLANIGTDADNGNNALTAGTEAADYNALPNVSGAIPANEAAYLAYIAANAAAFDSPATEAQVQAMIDAVNNPPAPTNPAGAGSFSGKTCFDVALGNDNTNSCGPLSARIATQANFTQAATHTQSYTFTPSGTVSNVRFVYINTNGSPVTAISGNNTGNNISTAVVATVNFVTTNTPFAGLTNANPHTADLYVIYNDGATNNGTDRQLKLTVNIKDCACCVAKVSATVWKEFLCHNLGANTSLDPHDMAQANAWGLNGAYVQWGRRGPNTTGDSRVDWVTATNTSNFAAAPTGSTIGTANFASISGWSAAAAANNAWRTAGGAKTANDPCPTGWRVPTSTEWTGVNSNNSVSRSGAWTSSATYYNSALHYGPNASTKLLTLPAAGGRANTNGFLYDRGSYGAYWSSTENSANARLLDFTSSNVYPTGSYNRRYGFSLRCIAE
jgi:uncharacterized protein (TIGR02145 family)